MENLKMKSIKLFNGKGIVPLTSNISLLSKLNFKPFKRKGSNHQRVNTEEDPSAREISKDKQCLTEKSKSNSKRSSRIHSSSLTKLKQATKNISIKTSIIKNFSHKKISDRKSIIDSKKMLRNSSSTSRKAKMPLKSSLSRKDPLESNSTVGTLYQKTETDQNILNSANIDGPEDLHFFNVNLVHSNKEFALKFDSFKFA